MNMKNNESPEISPVKKSPDNFLVP
jgi:hypothetical protein